MVRRLLRRWFARAVAGVPAPAVPAAAGGDWRPVARVSDLAPGRLMAIVVDGTQLAIGRDGKTWFAVQRRCPHRFGDLAAGRVERGALVCPDHKYRFALATGRHDGASAHCLVRYPVRVVGDVVEIDLRPLP